MILRSAISSPPHVASIVSVKVAIDTLAAVKLIILISIVQREEDYKEGEEEKNAPVHPNRGKVVIKDCF